MRKKGGAFKSLLDFCSRVDLRIVNKRVVESLIKCGAFDSLKGRRSQLLAVLDNVLNTAALSQRDISNGQTGLFDDDSLAPALEVALPDLPEEPPAQLLAWEREMTGFYITGHPLDKYHDVMEHLPPLRRVLSGEAKERQLVRVAGLVANAKRIATKKGDTMCFVTLEDYTHSIEIIAFPRVFYENMNLLTVDTPVVVEGRINLTDTGAKILADQMWSLDSYHSDYYVTIHEADASEENFQALRQIFTQYHGDYTVYLYMADKKQRIKAEPQYWLNGDPEAIKAIEGLFGEGSVQQR